MSTYGWAMVMLIITFGALYQLGVFDMGNYIQPTAEVVGFNSFHISRFIVHSSGEFEMDIINTLEDTVTITQLWADGSAFSNVSPSLPFNLSSGANLTLKASSSLGESAGSIYRASITIQFDVERGTTNHLDSGFLRGEYQPG